MQLDKSEFCNSLFKQDMKNRLSVFSKMVLSLLFVFSLMCCVSQKATTIVGGEYDAKKDVTEYFVFPYGSVSLPGKWNKTDYNTESKQQFFTNKDSVVVAIVFGRSKSYEFNKDGSLKGNDFLNSFKESHGLDWKILETDNINNYMIYRIYGITDESKFDSYFLMGEKNGSVSNFSVYNTNKWSESDKIIFLKNLYLQNK